MLRYKIRTVTVFVLIVTILSLLTGCDTLSNKRFYSFEEIQITAITLAKSSGYETIIDEEDENSLLLGFNKEDIWGGISICKEERDYKWVDISWYHYVSTEDDIYLDIDYDFIVSVANLSSYKKLTTEKVKKIIEEDAVLYNEPRTASEIIHISHEEGFFLRKPILVEYILSKDANDKIYEMVRLVA